ncbi:Hypothetical_protein [Hexamita inflata]|uniref:Hypothetical_protein n=1 Tax=Hexamita inflata TaxID=28002 RepID=A0AA86RK90_9EUKA|nr:Hypothetical protein HINF_LOCUS62828 [Hexamita inflata]
MQPASYYLQHAKKLNERIVVKTYNMDHEPQIKRQAQQSAATFIPKITTRPQTGTKPASFYKDHQIVHDVSNLLPFDAFDKTILHKRSIQSAPRQKQEIKIPPYQAPKKFVAPPRVPFKKVEKEVDLVEQWNKQTKEAERQFKIQHDLGRIQNFVQKAIDDIEAASLEPEYVKSKRYQLYKDLF